MHHAWMLLLGSALLYVQIEVIPPLFRIALYVARGGKLVPLAAKYVSEEKTRAARATADAGRQSAFP